MGRLASFKDSENRLTVERLRCTCLLRFSPCYKSGGGIAGLERLVNAKISLKAKKMNFFAPPLAYNCGNMKSWLVRTFQNAINFDSQFFIYRVSC